MRPMFSGTSRALRRTLWMLPLVLGAPFASVAAQVDTTKHSSAPLFTGGDAILAGAFTVSAFLIRSVDEHYAARLQDSSTQANRKLHVLAQLVRTTTAPGAYIIGTTMYLTGRIAKNDHLTELGLRGTESLLLGEAVGGVMKGFIGRQRPDVNPRNSHSIGFLRGFTDGDEYRSFPSGHSLAAFAAAAAVTSETSQWWPNTKFIIGPVLFTGAAVTAASRMYDNRHWASDVIVGAGIGTFAGLKVVRYHHAHPGGRLDKWLISGSIAPTSDGGHALRWSVLPGISLGGTPPAR
jgi:membrane-associated phospholipid phosphatase